MSSTNRGAERRADDAYETPAWCVHRLLDTGRFTRDFDRTWYEPACGSGAIIRAVLPRLIEHGVVTESEADVETLDERLTAERREAGATCLWEMVFCAWARKP